MCLSLCVKPGYPGASREVQSVADRENQGQFLPSGPHPWTVPGILQKVLSGFLFFFFLPLTSVLVRDFKALCLSSRSF